MANTTKKLQMIDRITLPSVLPTKGGFEKLIVVEDIKKKIMLTQEDIEKYTISSRGDKIFWTIPEGEQDEFEYEFTSLELSLLKEALKELDTKQELTTDMTGLYKLFVL